MARPRCPSLSGWVRGGGVGTFVSGFLAAPITRLFCSLLGVGRVWGVWYGVVV